MDGYRNSFSKIPSINQFISVSLQDEISEEDIDDSFKSMFAQLAGEVKSVCFSFSHALDKLLQFVIFM